MMLAILIIEKRNACPAAFASLIVPARERVKRRGVKGLKGEVHASIYLYK